MDQVVHGVYLPERIVERLPVQHIRPDDLNSVGKSPPSGERLLNLVTGIEQSRDGAATDETRRAGYEDSQDFAPPR